jgi:DNA-directed RNA polymerase specialized sigma24 family protein
MLTTYIDFRLVQWADWRARREDSGLGYPRQTSFSRLGAAGSFGAWTPEMNDQAYEVEKCVMALVAERREALLQMFCRTSTVKQKCVECFCSERTFYNRISAAKRDILGYLNDLAADIPLPVQDVGKKKVLDVSLQ